ncbi:MAG: NUDIX hydrolase [Polyangiales bacterium]
MLKPWTLLDAKLLVETRIFKLFADRYRSPRTGEENTYSSIDSPDWVNVVALDSEGCMLLIRQFRFGTRSFTLEVPGGMVDPGEEPRVTAERELREETGYVAARITSLGLCEPNPAIFNNRCHFFLAEGCTRQAELVLDPGEDIEVLPTPVDEVFAQLHGGGITHALVMVALLQYELYRGGSLRLAASTLPNAAKLGTKP